MPPSPPSRKKSNVVASAKLLEQALDDLRKAHDREAETPPEHMKTCLQWAELLGGEKGPMSRPHATNKLKALVKSGKWETRKYRIKLDSGMRMIPHYGPKAS